MSGRLRKYSPILRVLPQCPDDILSALCYNPSNDFIKVIAEISFNLLHATEIVLTQRQINKLRPMRPTIEKLSDGRSSLKIKRRILKRSGVQLLKVIISPILPIITLRTVS